MRGGGGSVSGLKRVSLTRFLGGPPLESWGGSNSGQFWVKIGSCDPSWHPLDHHAILGRTSNHPSPTNPGSLTHQTGETNLCKTCFCHAIESQAQHKRPRKTKTEMRSAHPQQHTLCKGVVLTNLKRVIHLSYSHLLAHCARAELYKHRPRACAQKR